MKKREAQFVDVSKQWEHKTACLPLMCSLRVIYEEFGEGFFWYFAFEKYLIVVNGILLLIQAVVYSVFLYRHPDIVLDPELSLQQKLSIELFPSTDQVVVSVWYVGLGLSVILSLVAGPVYWFLAPIWWRRLRGVDVQKRSAVEDIIKRYDRKLKPENRNHVWQLTVTYFWFCLLLAVLCFLAQKLTLMKNTSEGTMTMAIAATLAIVNIIFKEVGILLTKYQHPTTWTRFRAHEAFKLITFKLMSTVIVFSFRKYPGCSVHAIAHQLVDMLVIELTVANVGEILAVEKHIWLARAKIWWYKKRGKTYSTEEEWVQNLKGGRFDIAEDYLDIYFKQFIILICSIISPPAAVLGWVGTMVEYWIDRVKLLRLCRHPPRLSDAMHFSSSVYLFTLSILALCTPYVGILWIASGEASKLGSEPCAFPPKEYGVWFKHYWMPS